MNIPLTRSAWLTSILLISLSNNALANCQWTHGALGITIQSTSDRLKNYAQCQQNCQKLGHDLAQTIQSMKTAYQCSPQVLTPKNRQMIDFFASRFVLIQRQKNSHVQTASQRAANRTQPVRTPQASPQPTAIARPRSHTASTTTHTPSQATAAVKRKAAAANSMKHRGQTKMTISAAAYQTLWLEDDRHSHRTPSEHQAPFAQARKLREMQIARQREYEKQRQLHLQKQKRLQQQQREANARKQRRLQMHHQQRLLRQQQLDARTRVNHLKQRALQQ